MPGFDCQDTTKNCRVIFDGTCWGEYQTVPKHISQHQNGQKSGMNMNNALKLPCSYYKNLLNYHVVTIKISEP